MKARNQERKEILSFQRIDGLRLAYRMKARAHRLFQRKESICD
jgi:hypothetical protein